jgi:GT2 family glycosyltransferase
MTMAARSEDLAAVVVHYRSLSTLPLTLVSLIESGIPPERLVVVDNSEAGVTGEDLQAIVPPESILLRTANEGYAAAVNRGLVAVWGLQEPPEYVLVATHEVRTTAHSLGALTSALNANAGLGAVGPMLTTSGGQFWSAGGRLTPFLRQPRHLAATDGASAAGLRTVAWLDGAVVLYRAEAIRGRPLEEGYFLYMEEVDYHLSLTRSGWGIAACGAATASQDSSGMPAFYAARNTQIFQARWGRPGFRWLATASVMSRGMVRAVLSRDYARLADLGRGYMAGRKVRQ